MPVTQERLTRLRDFGLSEYAARAYLALLDLGIAEARDVSSISKVPQAKIYHVLEQLHDKGLVVILPEFPKKYAPVPFEEYLQRIHEEHVKAARSIEDEREELAEMFRVMGDTDVGDRGFFTVIRGRRNVLVKLEEMLAQTSGDLLVLGTEGTTQRIHHLANELARARQRGVSVRLLAPIHEETLPSLERLEGVEVHARELDEADQSAKVAIAIADGARAFLIHFVPDDGNLYQGKDIGVFTDQEAMVAAIRAIVEPLWTRSPSLAARRAQLTGTPAPAHEAGDDARERLRRAFEDAPVPVALADLDGRLVQANAAFGRMVGRPAAQLAGAPLRDLVHPADRAAHDAALQRLLAGAVPDLPLDVAYVHDSGHEIRARVSLALARDAQGRPREVVAHVVGVSDDARIPVRSGRRAA